MSRQNVKTNSDIVEFFSDIDRKDNLVIYFVWTLCPINDFWSDTAGNCQMFDWFCTCDTEFSSYDSWVLRNMHAKLTKTEQPNGTHVVYMEQMFNKWIL